jgi:hypothetical protein
VNFTDIRRRVVVALFSDGELLESLVFKGGNALELVHGVLTRGSVDVDFSIAGEFSDIQAVQIRIFNALRREFEPAGYVLFDEHFDAVPREQSGDSRPWWGGYFAEFKLIEKALADSLDRDMERMRIQAQTFDPQHGRKFRIEISKYEFCEGKVSAKLDEGNIFVYTEEMCVLEKLRAICQQMPTYGRSHPTPRARDFYDIYATVTNRGIDLTLPENLDLLRSIFAAKHVPLSLLRAIAETREFHRPDWDAVRLTVVGEVFEFDVYFGFVLEQVARLHSLWDE